MSTFKAVIMKGGAHTKRDGTSNIKIRITHNRKADYIATDLYVMVDDIDNASGIVTGGKNREYINFRVTQIINGYQENDIKLGERRQYMTVKQIKEHLLNGKSSAADIDFMEFSEQYLKTLREDGTINPLKTTLSSLRDFNGDSLPVNEITLNFLYRYEAFLRGRGVAKGITNYLTNFRTLFNRCRDHYNDDEKGTLLIAHYPFKKYKIQPRSTEAREHTLTLPEMKKLVNCSPAGEWDQFARDMYLLMFLLIGIEAKDLYYLGKPKKGRVVYQRFKTKKPFSIKLEPEAIEIINRHKGKDRLLNVSERFESNKQFINKVNTTLHNINQYPFNGILQKLGIPKRATTKWARHTWATIARNDCRIDKDDVALCLGHEDMDNQVTDMYIKYDYTIIDKCNRKVIDKVFGVLKKQ